MEEIVITIQTELSVLKLSIFSLQCVHQKDGL